MPPSGLGPQRTVASPCAGDALRRPMPKSTTLTVPAGAEDLQGNLPVEREVAGAEHAAERSSAQLGLDSVRADHAVGPQLPAGVQRWFPAPPLRRAQPSHLQPFEHAEDLFGVPPHRKAVN